MRKFSILILLLLIGTAMADEIEREVTAAEKNREATDLADWMGDNNYNESQMYAVSFIYKPSTDKLLEVYTAALEDPSLSVTAWSRLAEVCRPSTKQHNSFYHWCLSNRISQRYQKLDSHNAWAYLMLLNERPERLFSKANIFLLGRAADAKFINSYSRQGLSQYFAHILEYYRLHPELAAEVIAGVISRGGSNRNVEDMAATYVGAYSTRYAPGYYTLASICNPEMIPVNKYTAEIGSNCLEIANKINTGPSTTIGIAIANTIISRLSDPGSDRQLEAERRRIVEKQINRCLHGWSKQNFGEYRPADQSKIFARALPLYALHSENKAWALAADAFYQENHPELESKPSDCLLLTDLDYTVAKKLQRDSGSGY